MNRKDFDDLAESIKQAGEIKKGQRPPGRIFDLRLSESDELATITNQNNALTRPLGAKDNGLSNNVP